MDMLKKLKMLLLSQSFPLTLRSDKAQSKNEISKKGQLNCKLLNKSKGKTVYV